MESLRGPMIINVWGSWCSTCLAETPEFVSFYSKAKGKIQLVGVAVEESSPENSEKFIIENGMTWPNYYDRENITRGYFGMGVPVTWFIDAQGVVNLVPRPHCVEVEGKAAGHVTRSVLRQG
jgi:thiol-disulfide isomerase/thioredoxin